MHHVLFLGVLGVQPNRNFFDAVGSYPELQTDDLSDEGDLQSKPDAVQAGHDISVSVYTNPDGLRPQYPYAAMFYEFVFSLRFS